MISGQILRAWKTVEPHVPLIRFRKGGVIRGPEHSEKSAYGTNEKAEIDKLNVNVTARPVIEDWQLPPQYRRSLLDETEIQSINGYIWKVQVGCLPQMLRQREKVKYDSVLYINHGLPFLQSGGAY